MRRLYQGLLRLYPAAYQQEFGEEMQCVFLQAQSELRTWPLMKRARFCAREIVGLFSGAVQVQLRLFLGADTWLALRRINMRPAFRFPRSTVFLMCVILAGVVLAIHKAKAVAGINEGLPATVTIWDPVLWLCPLGVVLAVVGAVWGILFTFRRTGIHRLDRAQAWPEQK